MHLSSDHLCNLKFWLHTTTALTFSSSWLQYHYDSQGLQKVKTSLEKGLLPPRLLTTAPTTRHQIRSSNFHLHRHGGTFGQAQRRYPLVSARWHSSFLRLGSSVIIIGGRGTSCHAVFFTSCCFETLRLRLDMIGTGKTSKKR